MVSNIEGRLAGQHLVAVKEPVAVAVADLEVGVIGEELLAVPESVIIGVGHVGIGQMHLQFIRVAESVTVRIGGLGVGMMDRHFIAIRQTIAVIIEVRVVPNAVMVSVERLGGVERKGVFGILDPVVIRVGLGRVGAILDDFLIISQSVIVIVVSVGDEIRRNGLVGIH